MLSFRTADDFVASADRMLSAGLVESEPPRAQSVGATIALRLCPTGSYYWAFLVRSFAYLDLVLADTPLHDEQLARTLGEAAAQHRADYSLSAFTDLRLKRVAQFIDYLSTSEAEELVVSAKQGGPYRDALAGAIRDQLEREMVEIRRRVGIT
jgi:hypothetical protein